jgi:hypothetical protein
MTMIARIVMTLITALLLLVLIVGEAHAGALYVDCYLKKDWPPYKAGDWPRFVLPEINRTIYDDLQHHCDFFLRMFVFRIDAEIDRSVETALISLKKILETNTIFRKYVESASVGVSIELNAYGGDVNTALRVGQIIRDIQAEVSVEPHDKCISSCIFLLLGGVARKPRGDVGIHCPSYSTPSTKLTPSEISRADEQQRSLIAKYLDDMNVPLSLLDFIYETPADAIHLLSRAELAKYHLDLVDPIFDGRRTAFMAALRGVTSAEYQQRIIKDDSICGAFESTCKVETEEQIAQCRLQRLTCTDAVSWGLSIPEYLKRNNEAVRCPSLRDSASVDAFVACIKAAMLSK